MTKVLNFYPLEKVQEKFNTSHMARNIELSNQTDCIVLKFKILRVMVRKSYFEHFVLFE